MWFNDPAVWEETLSTASMMWEGLLETLFMTRVVMQE